MWIPRRRVFQVKTWRQEYARHILAIARKASVAVREGVWAVGYEIRDGLDEEEHGIWSWQGERKGPLEGFLLILTDWEAIVGRESWVGAWICFKRMTLASEFRGSYRRNKGQSRETIKKPVEGRYWLRWECSVEMVRNGRIKICF